jgi:hypothetical protein
MMRTQLLSLVASSVLCCLIGSNVASAESKRVVPEAAPSCHEQKLRAASQYFACLVRELGDEDGGNRCRTQFLAAFERAERLEPDCGPLLDPLRVERRIRDGIEALVGGTASPSPCAAIEIDGDQVICNLIEYYQQSSQINSVNLAGIVAQLQAAADCPTCNAVTADTVMWIQAWGGGGGCFAGKSCGGGAGFAQTITTVSDLAGRGIADLFFSIGEQGNGGYDSGGSGGAGTLVTTRDLTLTRGTAPTLAETLLVAGGGGGDGGYNRVCITSPPSPYGGGMGGVAIASLGVNGSGHGNTDGSGRQGGGGDGVGAGNARSGIGGMGGAGGEGPGKNAFPATGWVNTGATPLTFTDGAGANGATDTNSCTSGGGGGGGGWGGGSGGSHGNTTTKAQGGGGGGSYAVASTRSDSDAPTDNVLNPDRDPNFGFIYTGFLRIVFNLSPN